jgi:hypothetical protein
MAAERERALVMGDRWIKLEFAVLLVVVLLIYFQMARFAWDLLTGWL